MNISKKKQIRIAVMAVNNIEDSEFIVPIDIWRRANFIVDVIVCEMRNSFSLSYSGLKISSNAHNLQHANLQQYDAIYLPGGKGYKGFLTPPATSKGMQECKLTTAIKKFYSDKNKWLIALCASPIVYNSILETVDKNLKTKFTAFNDPDLLKGFESNWLDKRFVVDKNMITAQAAGCSFDLAFIAIEKLHSKELAEEIAKEVLYPWDIIRKLTIE